MNKDHVTDAMRVLFPLSDFCGWWARLFVLSMFPLMLLPLLFGEGRMPLLALGVFFVGAVMVGLIGAWYMGRLIKRNVFNALDAIERGAAETHFNAEDRALIISRIEAVSGVRYLAVDRELLRVPLGRVDQWERMLADHDLLPDRLSPRSRPLFGADEDVVPGSTDLHRRRSTVQTQFNAFEDCATALAGTGSSCGLRARHGWVDDGRFHLYGR